MLINQTLDKLDALGLFGMGLGLREQLESTQYLNLSFDERLGLLVDRETEARDSRRLALRLKAAKLRQEACVEDIDFRTPRGLDRSVIMSLAQAGWVTAHHNLLVTGPAPVSHSSGVPWPTPPSVAGTPRCTSARRGSWLIWRSAAATDAMCADWRTWPRSASWCWTIFCSLRRALSKPRICSRSSTIAARSARRW
jgi:hypothetical protein